ncbi:MAG: ribonuclease J [Chloroflexi bacterium]|nr:ribonuclease J [Chloroflexota bacterium]
MKKIRIIPLGGLGEIGKNMLALEYGDDIIVIDAGLMFPEEEMLGVDLVIPDISYLLTKKENIRGIIITHGHEDHLGALPYVLPKLDVPVYSTKLTNGLIYVKLKEHRLTTQARLNVVQPGTKFTLGQFEIEPFRVNHSIPDSVGLIIQTPIGKIVHSGDFKIDHTPVDGKPTDLSRLAQLGEQGVLLLLSDSTYVEHSGYTPSERTVGISLDRYIGDAPGRVIIATFASHISRIQQVFDAAVKHKRRVVVIGHSMVNNVKMAMKLGYISIPEDLLAKTWELTQIPNNELVVVMAGTQGEPTSTLVKMANKDQSHMRVIPGDTIIMSATPIPGNETLINKTIDNLFRQGARVLYGGIADVHVHGHASQEELKMLITLIKPHFFIPIHGEYRHLVLHGKVAESLAVPASNVFVIEDGEVLELDQNHGKVVEKISAVNVYVDGLGVGDIGQVVLRDRWLLSQDGVVVIIVTIDRQTGKVVERPDIVTRGFVDMDVSEDVIEQAKDAVEKALHTASHLAEIGFISTKIKDTVSKLLYQQTKRRPMILPIAIEV